MQTLGLFSESVQTPNVTWLLWVALGFFAVMVVVGWLASKRVKPDEEQEQALSHQEHADPHN